MAAGSITRGLPLLSCMLAHGRGVGRQLPILPTLPGSTHRLPHTAWRSLSRSLGRGWIRATLGTVPSATTWPTRSHPPLPSPALQRSPRAACSR